MHVILKVFKWILKAIGWAIAGILCIIVVVGLALYIRQYAPSVARSKIMDPRFGFSEYFPEFPEFRTIKYKPGISAQGIKHHEYILRFSNQLPQETLFKIDSLVAIDDNHPISGWRFSIEDKEYCYFFDDIARDVSDSLFIASDGKTARFIREVF